MAEWQKRRILIWGKTRPELSKTYREIVCTGGVFEDGPGLIRLYPIPLRYMDDEKVFKKYQWIEAYVARSTSDPRPESYRIRADGIRVEKVIGTQRGTWEERGRWILQPSHIFRSVETLQECQRADHTSLGLVRPAAVTEIRAERSPPNEKAEYMTRYEASLKQMDLPLDPETGRQIKPLRAPDYHFKIRFRCDDDRCRADHKFSVLDWEMDALYFNLRQRGPARAAADGVVDKLRN